MVTIKDIARLAGVSTGTVSRVLHNQGRFSSETAEIVNKIVKETGYTPNCLARNFSRNLVQKIGVILPLAKNDSGYWKFSIDGVKYIESQFAAYKIIVEVFLFDRYDIDSFKVAWSSFLEAKCSGVLVVPVDHPECYSLLSALDTRFPIVILDSKLDSKSDLKLENSIYVGQDKIRSGALCGKIMKMLLFTLGTMKGKLLVALHEPSFARFEKFRDFFKDTAYEIEVLSLDNENKEESYRVFFEKNDISQFCGIYTTDESGFIPARLKGEAGLNFPIISYDLLPESVDQMKKGNLDIVISQRPEKQVYLGCQFLVNYLIWGTLQKKDVSMPLIIVSLENLAEFDFHFDQDEGEFQAVFLPIH